MKKKDIIIYSVIGSLVLIFLVFKYVKKSSGKKENKEHSFIASPDYDEDGFYVEKTENKFTKLNIFGTPKAKEEEGIAGKSDMKGTSYSDADASFDIFSGIGNKKDSNGANQTSSMSVSGTYGNHVTDSSSGGSVDIFGFQVSDGQGQGVSNLASNTRGKNICPCCKQEIKSAKSIAKSKKNKKGKAGKFNRGFASSFSGDTLKKPKKKGYTVSKKAAPVVVFNTIEIPITDTVQIDSLTLKKQEALVSLFFKAEMFGTQTVQTDRSIQVKVKEPIETPEHFFPSGTIFFGNIKQNGRRFTAQFHRALYNYNDYPVEFEMRLYDMTFSEGLLILDFEDEIKDQNTDELLSENAELAKELAITKSITSSMISVSEKTAKAMKKKKMYSLDLEDGYEVLLSVEVPNAWFYEFIENKESKYQY